MLLLSSHSPLLGASGLLAFSVNGKTFMIVHPAFFKMTFSFLICSLYLKGRVNRRERLRLFHSLVHFSNGLSGQVWTRLKSGAARSIQVSHTSGRDPRAWTICCYFPSPTSRELNLGCRCFRGSLTTPTPRLHFFCLLQLVLTVYQCYLLWILMLFYLSCS